MMLLPNYLLHFTAELSNWTNKLCDLQLQEAGRNFVAAK